MSQNLTIHKDKNHAAEALWWEPLFNMQQRINQKLSNMSSSFLPTDLWIDEREIFNNLEQQMHRLFEESFNMRQAFTPWFTGKPTAPYIDILEKEDSYTVYADVPGLAEEDIDVSAAAHTLVISGQKERHKKTNGEHYIHRECSTAPFQRTIALPESADPLQARIIFKHNVLIINVPKKKEKMIKPKPESRSRKIKVEKTEKKASANNKKRSKRAA